MEVSSDVVRLREGKATLFAIASSRRDQRRQDRSYPILSWKRGGVVQVRYGVVWCGVEWSGVEGVVWCGGSE